MFFLDEQSGMGTFSALVGHQKELTTHAETRKRV